MSDEYTLYDIAEFDISKLEPLELQDNGSSMSQCKFKYDGTTNYVFYTPVIKMDYGGIPQMNEWYPTDDKRRFCNIPVQPHSDFYKMLEQIQELVRSDAFMQKVVGKEEFDSVYFYNEHGIIKEPNDKLLDRDPNTPPTVKMEFKAKYNPSARDVRDRLHKSEVEMYDKKRIPVEKREYKFEKDYDPADDEILTEINVTKNIDAEDLSEDLEAINGEFGTQIVRSMDEIKKKYVSYRNKVIFFFKINKLWIFKAAVPNAMKAFATKDNPRLGLPKMRKYGISFLLTSVICQEKAQMQNTMKFKPNKFGLGQQKKKTLTQSINVESLKQSLPQSTQQDESANDVDSVEEEVADVAETKEETAVDANDAAEESAEEEVKTPTFDETPPPSPKKKTVRKTVRKTKN